MVFVSNLTVNIHVLAKEIYTGIVFWFLALMKNHFEWQRIYKVTWKNTASVIETQWRVYFCLKHATPLTTC